MQARLNSFCYPEIPSLRYIQRKYCKISAEAEKLYDSCGLPSTNMALRSWLKPSLLNISADSDSLSIIHLNIQSIRNKIDYIKDSLADFDILCFTETHLNHAISNEELFIEGFQPVKFRKDVSPHSAGLLTYVGEGLIAAHRPDLEVNLEESLWIEVKQKKGEPYLGPI